MFLPTPKRIPAKTKNVSLPSPLSRLSFRPQNLPDKPEGEPFLSPRATGRRHLYVAPGSLVAPKLDEGLRVVDCALDEGQGVRGAGLALHDPQRFVDYAQGAVLLTVAHDYARQARHDGVADVRRHGGSVGVWRRSGGERRATCVADFKSDQLTHQPN